MVFPPLLVAILYFCVKSKNAFSSQTSHFCINRKTYLTMDHSHFDIIINAHWDALFLHTISFTLAKQYSSFVWYFNINLGEKCRHLYVIHNSRGGIILKLKDSICNCYEGILLSIL